MKAEPKPAVQVTGPSLMEVHGIGPAAAGILADAGDIARFPAAAISRPGTAPPRSMPPAASMRHRLSRAGNPGIAHNAAANAGVLAMSRTLAVELLLNVLVLPCLGHRDRLAVRLAPPA